MQYVNIFIVMQFDSCAIYVYDVADFFVVYNVRLMMDRSGSCSQSVKTTNKSQVLSMNKLFRIKMVTFFANLSGCFCSTYRVDCRGETLKRSSGLQITGHYKSSAVGYGDMGDPSHVWQNV